MPIAAGDAFYLPIHSTVIPHLWIILTDPDENHQALVVNLTTYEGLKDSTVVLNIGDHPFIHKKTVVKYGAAKLIDAIHFENQIRAGWVERKERCSTELLNKIREGFLRSDYSSGDAILYLKRRLGL